MLRIGVVGGGQIAKLRHLPEYRVNKECTIVAVYDTDHKNAEKLASEFNCTSYSESFEEFLNENMDAVSICVPNFLHYTYVLSCLEAGLNVLCEKPLAMSYDECCKLVETAREKKKLLMVAQNQRYDPSHQYARSIIQKDAIGKITGFSLTFGHSGPENWSETTDPWFFHKEKANYGAIADLGIHKIDLLRYLTGLEVDEVGAFITTVDKKFPDGRLIEVDDNAIYTLRLKNGAIGTVKASWTFYTSEDNSSRIYGTKGLVRIHDNPDYSVIVEKTDGTVIRNNFNKMATNLDQINGLSDSTGVIDAFVDAILNGTESDSSGADVLKSMNVVFAGIAAAKQRKTIKLE
ncbi:MAG: Gfo/Idh/MocA family oxidoreductase [Clostridiales bacterium]|nr:Gfo/Idh/MocA family oxidoreductase [Clostridiales bacterium]